MTFIAYAALISFLIYGHWVRDNIRRQYLLNRKASFEIRHPTKLMKRADSTNAKTIATDRDLEEHKAAAATPASA